MEELLDLAAVNPIAALTIFALAIGAVIGLFTMAGARLDESCEPARSCSNCGRCTENGLSESCAKCVDAYPSAPMWIPAPRSEVKS